MADTTITMDDYIEGLIENSTPTDAAKVITKELDEEVKYTEKSDVGGGGVGGGIAPWRFPAGSWDYPDEPAPLDTDVGTYGKIKRHLHDDTDIESVNNLIKIPSTATGSMTLTVEFWGYAVTADGNKVQYRLQYSPIADTETWDQAYQSLDSGDKVTSGSQDVLNKYTFSDTLTNLGINPDELVRIKFLRIAIDGGTPVGGDWGSVYVEIGLV